MKNNPVEHPNHYNWIPEIETMDVVKHFSFCLGNAFKYIWRAPHKAAFEDFDGALEDLKKARYYIDIEIDKLQTEEHMWRMSK